MYKTGDHLQNRKNIKCCSFSLDLRPTDRPENVFETQNHFVFFDQKNATPHFLENDLSTRTFDVKSDV